MGCPARRTSGLQVRETTVLQTLTQEVVKTSATEGERLDESKRGPPPPAAWAPERFG
ncbi:DUF4172 domain-containing protein [Mesorhizobium sp.]|uniref:DUF4172 domain-containing protein n=1 Tax=Mesorhizobium sp. TaxID=1871066 RepID=UPI0034596120